MKKKIDKKSEYVRKPDFLDSNPFGHLKAPTDGMMPENDEDYEDFGLDDSTITAEKVQEAVLLGDAFEPKNEAERLLKQEIAEHDGIIDIPNE